MADLRNHVALVTGGSRGIGRAVALAIADAGASVAVLGRNADDVAAVAGEVRDRGVEGLGVRADVSDGTAVTDAVRRVVAELGPVDLLVASAGVVWPLGRSAEVDPEEWAQSVAVNLSGAFRTVRAVLPGMLAAGWGRIVAVSSGAGSPPGMPSASAYSAAKAGLDMLTLHLADELAGSGVTANAVRPGVVDTGMQDFMRGRPPEQVGERFHDRFHGLHDRGELLTVDVPARFVVRLVATDLSGEILDVRDEAAEARLAAAEGTAPTG